MLRRTLRYSPSRSQQQRAFVYLSIIAQDFIIEASTSRLLSEKQPQRNKLHKQNISNNSINNALRKMFTFTNEFFFGVFIGFALGLLLNAILCNGRPNNTGALIQTMKLQSITKLSATNKIYSPDIETFTGWNEKYALVGYMWYTSEYLLAISLVYTKVKYTMHSRCIYWQIVVV